MNIFVSIAAYRDPELGPTLRDCLTRARYPDDLRFGICWQHGEDEAPLDVFADRRMRVIDVPWHVSRGACWARAEVMKLWDHEDFFFQIDSHHRFVQDWDAKLLFHAGRSGATRPLLTTYAAAYERDADTPPGEPTQMELGTFIDAGIPTFQSRVIENWQSLGRPLQARFVSAHFLFTLGRFVDDVPYDPELYFIGEEITLSVRAFTHGYTLLHPPEHILWHEYTRKDRQKHWDDHVPGRGVEMEWYVRDAASLAKARHFLTAPHVGAFGCGTARSFAEYEAYAGLSFVHCAAQEATLRGLEPPNPPLPPTWPLEIRIWRMRIVLERAALPPAALDSPKFWYVGFHDSEDTEIYRADAAGEELQRLVAGDSAQIVIEREFRSMRQPANWTVWPVGTDGAWLEKSIGPISIA